MSRLDRPIRFWTRQALPLSTKSIPWSEVLIFVRETTHICKADCIATLPFNSTFSQAPHFFPGYGQLCEFFALHYFPRAIQALSRQSHRHFRPEFPFSSEQCRICAMGIPCDILGHGEWKKCPHRASAVQYGLQKCGLSSPHR